MKFRKALTVALCGTMVLGLLSGCGGSSSSSSGGGAAAGSAAAGSTAAATVEDTSSKYTEDSPYEVTFAYTEFNPQDDAARAEVQTAMNEYLIPTYHIKVNLLPLQYAETDSKLQLMLSGGDTLDVMPIFFSNAASWINMGGIYNMMDLMGTEDGAKIIEALGEQNAYVGQMNGVLYGFPANKESVELGGLGMRADICDELGITEKYGLELNKDEYEGVIYDWSVAEDIFATVKAAHPEMTPLYMYSSSQMNRFAFFDTLVDNFGVLDWEADHKSTTVVNEFETDTYKNVVKMLADWYDKGYIYKDAATDTQGSSTVMKAGNTFAYASAIKPGWLAQEKANLGFDTYAMYFGPTVEGGISTTNVSFFNTGIANNSKDPVMAFKFVSILYSDPTFYNMWQYGLEGKTYKKLDDGTIYYADGVDPSNCGYFQNTGWYLGNQFQSYVWNDGTKDADYWKKLQHHNEWAVYTPSYGFMWDSTNFSTQITALTNALNTYRATLETGSCGAANVDSTLQQLNDALNAAGLADVMAEKQKQLDAWLANNNGYYEASEAKNVVGSAVKTAP